MRAERLRLGFAAALLAGVAAAGCGEDPLGIRGDDGCAPQTLYRYVEPAPDAGTASDPRAWDARLRRPDKTPFTAAELAAAKAAFAAAVKAKCLTGVGHALSIDGG